VHTLVKTNRYRKMHGETIKIKMTLFWFHPTGLHDGHAGIVDDRNLKCARMGGIHSKIYQN